MDTIAPKITFTDSVSSRATGSDNIVFSVDEANPDAASQSYWFSKDTTCANKISEKNFSSSGASVTISDSLHN